MKSCLTILLGFSTLFILSCSSSDPSCRDMNFRALDFSEFSGMVVVDDSKEDLFLVINSRNEFDEFIDFGNEDGTYFDIDFETETLLMGKVRLIGIDGRLVEQRLQQCDDTVQYDLTVMNGGYHAIGRFYFGVVTSKIDASQVAFNVQTTKFDP